MMAVPAAIGGAIVSIGVALLLVVLASEIGRSLMGLFDAQACTPLERALLSLGLGLGLVSFVPFTLGQLGLILGVPLLTPFALRAVWFVVTAWALIVFAIRCRRRTGPGGIPAGLAPAPENDRPGSAAAPPMGAAAPWAIVIGAVGAVFLVGVLASCLTPMVDVDGLAYHVAAPKRWLEIGAMRPLPTQLHTVWPMAAEMLNAWLLPVAGNRACKPLIWWLAAATAVAVYALGARLASRTVGVAAAGLFVVRAGVPTINTTSVEMVLTLYATLAALSLTIWRGGNETGRSARWLVLAGLCAGLACGTKLNGLLVLAFMVAATVLAAPVERGVRGRIRAGTIVAAIALVCAAPWYLRTWWLTGNPIFPLAYSWLGGRDWSARATMELSAYFRSFDLPGEMLADRQRFVMRHLCKLAALTVVGAALAAPRRIRLLILGSGAFMLIQAAVSDNPRFMLPSVPFVAIAIAWWIDRTSRRSAAPAWCIAAIVATVYVHAAYREAMPSLPVVVGLRPRREFVRYYANCYDAFLWMNQNVPGDARVLYGPDNRGYYLERDTYWSNALFQKRIRYDTQATFLQTCRRLGITHLALNHDSYRDPQIAYEIRMRWRSDEYARLAEAARSWPRIWHGRGVEVFRRP